MTFRRTLLLLAVLLAGCEAPITPPDLLPNQPPVVISEIPSWYLRGPGATQMLDLNGNFTDPDGDSLVFAAASSDTTVVRVSMAGRLLTITGGVTGGTARVTVTAHDPHGAEASFSFGVTVNRAPVAFDLPAQTVAAEAVLGFDVAEYFADPDGEALTFAAVSSDTTVIRVSTAGSVVMLTGGIGEGAVARVTVTARDPEGNEASGSLLVTVTENPDRAALVTLYEATGGPNWHQSDNWLTDAPLGEWHGVTVSNGRVVQLKLDHNNLTGPIPTELGDLANLESLDVGNNELTGAIPTDLGNLGKLEYLMLYGNELTGAIAPELGNLTSLKGMNLYANELTGTIPPELGSLASLQVLNLYGNELTGTIPPELVGQMINGVLSIC